MARTWGSIDEIAGFGTRNKPETQLKGQGDAKSSIAKLEADLVEVIMSGGYKAHRKLAELVDDEKKAVSLQACGILSKAAVAMLPKRVHADVNASITPASLLAALGDEGEDDQDDQDGESYACGLAREPFGDSQDNKPLRSLECRSTDYDGEDPDD